MAKKLYTARNYLSVLANYSGAIALGTGAYMFGSPWAVVSAAAIGGGLSLWAIREQKKFFESQLKPHPESHRDSPRLGEMVKELYQASGLKMGKYAVYDFAPNRQTYQERKNEKFMSRVMREILEKAAVMPNAAAMNLGKPIIMISEPLLKLLNDEEERAVLAHEFAHAASQHSRLLLPIALTASIAAMTAGFMALGAYIASGWGIAASFAGVGAVMGLFYAFHPHGKKIFKSDKGLSVKEVAEKAKVKKVNKAVTNVASVSLVAAFNPVYPVVWAAAKGAKATATVLKTNFSRSMEYQADRGAVVLGADPLALITALRKITAVAERSKKDAWGDTPVPQKGSLKKAWEKATATHPTLDRRIARLVALAKEQGIDEAVIKNAVEGPIDISKADNIPYDAVKAFAARL